MSRKSSRNHSRNRSRIKRLRPLASLLAAGLSFRGSPLLSPGVPDLCHRPAAERLVGRQLWPGHHPSRHTSQPWSPGPREGHRAEPQCPQSHRRRPHLGRVGGRRGVRHPHWHCPQNYITFGLDSSGSYSGIAYSADGKYLVFSQDSSNVTIAKVNAQGLLEDDAQVSVPREQFLHQPAFRTARSALMASPVARSIARGLLIPAVSRSQRMARAPTPC